MRVSAKDDLPSTSKPLRASFPQTNLLTAVSHGDKTSKYSGSQYKLGDSSQAQRGPLPQVLKILFLSSLPCLIVLVRTSFDLVYNLKASGEAERMQHHVMRSLDIVNAVHATQLERGSTIIYISSGKDPNTTDRMQRSYIETDASFSKLSQWVTMETKNIEFRSLNENLESIRDFRRILGRDHTASISIYKTLEFYSGVIETLIETLAKSLQSNAASKVWREFVAYHLLTLGKESAGEERALGCTHYTQGDFRFLQYHEALVLGNTFIQKSMHYDSYARSLLSEQYTDSMLEGRISQLRTDILYHHGQDVSVTACESWFDTMSLYIELLKGVQHQLGNHIILKINAEIETTRHRMPLHVTLITVAALLTGTIVFEMYLLNRKAFRYAYHLLQKSMDIEDQRIKSQQLVLKALPENVATEMLLGNVVLPERHLSVSVMFTEIVEFSELVAHVKTEELVDFISAVVIAFDERLQIYDVHKMEMMGGTTMLASGFQDRGDEDVFEIADAAKDLMTTLSNVAIPHSDTTGTGMHLRIGINTGPVVTGLVGNKLPRYSVFGDTVNIASRMTSTALPGTIQLTDVTRTSLITNGSYQIELRGAISIKGRGNVTAYVLLVPPEEILVSEDYRHFSRSRGGNSRAAKSVSEYDINATPQPFFEDTSSTVRHLSETINCRLPYV